MYDGEDPERSFSKRVKVVFVSPQTSGQSESKQTDSVVVSFIQLFL